MFVEHLYSKEITCDGPSHRWEDNTKIIL